MIISSGYIFARQISPTEVPSKYASRNKILEWIIADGENYAQNFSFAVPSTIYIRSQGGWQYNVFDTGWVIDVRDPAGMWVQYDPESGLATNTFDTKTNQTLGAYISRLGNGNGAFAFRFDSAINGTAQRSWRTTNHVQENDGIEANGSDQIFGALRIDAPVFLNYEDASEYIALVKAYVTNPNSETLGALKTYLQTTKKMVNL